jgi:hypothetical protein
MGKRLIVMPPLVPYIPWASGSIKWYGDNVTVVKQMEYNSWDKAIEKLYEVMENEIS